MTSFTLSFANNASANKVFVTDTLQLGVHAENDLNSIVIDLVPSSTILRVIEKKGAMVKVETPSKKIGWVDSNLITTNQPLAVRLQEMVTEREVIIATLENAIADYEKSVAELKTVAAKIDSNDVSATANKSNFQQQKVSNSKEATKADIEKATKLTLKDIQKLANQNNALKELVSKLETEIAALRTEHEVNLNTLRQRHSTVTLPGLFDDLFRLPLWVHIALVSFLLLIFFLGMALMDWFTRNKHGGFRV